MSESINVGVEMEEEIKLKRLRKAERSRTYVWPGNVRVTYYNVVAVLARPSGTHRLELENGSKVVVMKGFLAIEIDANEWSF